MVVSKRLRSKRKPVLRWHSCQNMSEQMAIEAVNKESKGCLAFIFATASWPGTVGGCPKQQGFKGKADSSDCTFVHS